MRPSLNSSASILSRIAQLEDELRQVRVELKKLRSKDPATAMVVLRGARLSRERASLEQQLESFRLSRSQATFHSLSSTQGPSHEHYGS
jgi:hypothetical protein